MLIIDMPMQTECRGCRFWRTCTDNTNYAFDGHNLTDKAERCIIKGELVRCGECKYKPHWGAWSDPKERTGFDIEFPECEEGNRCPCQCEDKWYAHIPDDDFYCANGAKMDGERKEGRE